MRLLQEIDDLQEADKVFLNEQKKAKRDQEKENKKKMHMKRQGADIRFQAMRTLNAAGQLHVYICVVVNEGGMSMYAKVAQNELIFTEENKNESADDEDVEAEKENKSDNDDSQADTAPKAKSK